MSRLSKFDLNGLRKAIPVAGIHLTVSLVVVGLVAALNFLIWFPQPFGEISGGQSIFWLLVLADAICGPMLTLILYRPTKTKLAWKIDLVLIVAVQTGALSYGLYTLSLARPIAIVYEVDRFRVISYADIAPEELDQAPPWVSPLGFQSPKMLGIRMAKNIEEKIASVDSSLQGVEPSQRPKYWEDYSLSISKIRERSYSLDRLRSLYPTSTGIIDATALKAAGVGGAEQPLTHKNIRWLPVVSRHATDWVALIDSETARIKGYIHLDGFGGQ